MEVSPIILVNELKGKIVSKGLTQEEVAKLMGITPKTLSLKLKSGVMGSDEIEKLMDILEIEDPRYIFFGLKVS